MELTAPLGAAPGEGDVERGASCAFAHRRRSSSAVFDGPFAEMSEPANARCAACGDEMTVRDVAPCLDCGGDPDEVRQLLRGDHRYGRVGLFDGEVLCDFCDADMPSTDPRFWGFREDLDWDRELAAHAHEELAEAPAPRRELACRSCSNTLRKQEFIRRNAERNGIVVPQAWWPFLGGDGRRTSGRS
jgi:hypothetical protein